MATTSTFKQRVKRGRWPMSVEIPVELKERLQKQAEREQRSMAAIMRIATQDYLEAHEPSPNGRRKR